MQILAQASPDMVNTLVGGSPIAAALIASIIIFMRHISKTEDRREESEKARIAADLKHTESLESIGRNCHEFQREMTNQNLAVMNKVNDTLARNNTALEINSRLLEKTLAKVEPIHQ